MSNLKEKKIGILGGSFDPPHKGHVKITKISLSKINFHKIYWVIAKKNPFKKSARFSVKERVIKSKKLLKTTRNVNVSYIDDKIRSSRMINVVNYFIKKKKKKSLYLILGADCLLDFHKWTRWKKIVKLTKLVVFSRKGYDKKSKKSTVVKYLNKKNIIFIKNKPINISSSIIKRGRLKKF